VVRCAAKIGSKDCARLTIIHHSSNPFVGVSNLLDCASRNYDLLSSVAGSLNKSSTGNVKGEVTMRVLALALAGMLSVFFFADTHAFAAKRGSASYGNPDRNPYQSAAGVCGGNAYCYRSGSHKHPKKH
jgi:hypothetical protein